MRRATLGALVAAALLLAGCSAADYANGRLPVCGEAGVKTTFLMAQAAPEATLVPCLAPGAKPASWTLEAIKIDNAGARLAFIADTTSGQPQRIEVLFSGACDVSGAVSVPSDEQGTERFEHVDSVEAGYVGQRSYVFDGGCAMYRFSAPGEGWSGFVHDASTALTFMPRTEVVRLRDIALDRP
ncbi:hypothetical protein BH23ACT10_BH23ACT10_35250 [soil metagenome]